MPRPANPQVRSRLLVAGTSLFLRYGVNATGVKDIAELAGVPKGSFYSYFPSKDKFVVCVLDVHWAELERGIGPLLTDRRDPLERLKTYFRAVADEHERNEFMFGCLIGNLGLELAGSSAMVAERLREILCWWEGQLAAVLADANGHRCREVAALIIEAWEGAVFRAKTDSSRIPLARFEAVTLPILTGIRKVVA